MMVIRIAASAQEVSSFLSSGATEFPQRHSWVSRLMPSKLDLDVVGLDAHSCQLSVRNQVKMLRRFLVLAGAVVSAVFYVRVTSTAPGLADLIEGGPNRLFGWVLQCVPAGVLLAGYSCIVRGLRLSLALVERDCVMWIEKTFLATLIRPRGREPVFARLTWPIHMMALALGYWFGGYLGSGFIRFVVAVDIVGRTIPDVLLTLVGRDGAVRWRILFLDALSAWNGVVVTSLFMASLVGAATSYLATVVVLPESQDRGEAVTLWQKANRAHLFPVSSVGGLDNVEAVAVALRQRALSAGLRQMSLVDLYHRHYDNLVATSLKSTQLYSLAVAIEMNDPSTLERLRSGDAETLQLFRELGIDDPYAPARDRAEAILRYWVNLILLCVLAMTAVTVMDLWQIVRLPFEWQQHVSARRAPFAVTGLEFAGSWSRTAFSTACVLRLLSYATYNFLALAVTINLVWFWYAGHALIIQSLTTTMGMVKLPYLLSPGLASVLAGMLVTFSLGSFPLLLAVSRIRRPGTHVKPDQALRTVVETLQDQAAFGRARFVVTDSEVPEVYTDISWLPGMSPRVVVTTAAATIFTASEMRAILSHELGHVTHDVLAIRILRFVSLVLLLPNDAATMLLDFAGMEFRADRYAASVLGDSADLRHALVRAQARPTSAPGPQLLSVGDAYEALTRFFLGVSLVGYGHPLLEQRLARLAAMSQGTILSKPPTTTKNLRASFWPLKAADGSLGVFVANVHCDPDEALAIIHEYREKCAEALGPLSVRETRGDADASVVAAYEVESARYAFFSEKDPIMWYWWLIKSISHHKCQISFSIQPSGRTRGDFWATIVATVIFFTILARIGGLREFSWPVFIVVFVTLTLATLLLATSVRGPIFREKAAFFDALSARFTTFPDYREWLDDELERHRAVVLLLGGALLLTSVLIYWSGLMHLSYEWLRGS